MGCQFSVPELNAKGIAAYDPFSMEPNANGQHLTPYPENTVLRAEPQHFVPAFEEDELVPRVHAILFMCKDHPNETLHFNGEPLYPSFYSYECSEENPFQGQEGAFLSLLSCNN